MNCYFLYLIVYPVQIKEVDESAIFDHCARPSSLVNRSKGSMKFFSPDAKYLAVQSWKKATSQAVPKLVWKSVRHDSRDLHTEIRQMVI